MLNNPAVPYVLPFVAFLAFLALDGKLGLSPEVEYPARVALLSGILYLFSRSVISIRIKSLLPTIGIGVLVFLLWIAPDLLIPGYRSHWLFNNSIVGHAPTPEQGYAHLSPVALAFRTIRAVILVPIIEELFWRAWLMRWIINPNFLQVPLGAYALNAFWISAALFAAEHGAFWDVGLLAGIVYNWWMVRTKSLGDLILAHAVTNGILSAYVLATGNWQYW